MKKLIISIVVCLCFLISGWFLSSYATQGTISEQSSQLSDENTQKLDIALEWIYQVLEEKYSQDNDAIINILDKLIIELNKYSQQDEKYTSIVSYLVARIDERIEEYAEIKVVADIVYDESCSKCSVDIYYKNNNIKDKKVIFFVHWWAWKIWDKSEHEIKWKYFAEEDYIFVSVNYTLFPEAEYTKQIAEIADAFSYAYKNIWEYWWNSNSISIVWHSAGGHLVSLLSTQETYLNDVDLELDNILSTILLDSAWLDIISVKEDSPLIFKLAYKDIFWSIESNLLEASPVSHIESGKNIPDFLIFYSDERNNNQSSHKNFHEALIKNSITSEINSVSQSHSEINHEFWTQGDYITEKVLELLK